MAPILIFVLIAIIAFVSTFFSIPPISKLLNERGIKGKDMNKISKPEVTEMGGLIVLICIISAIFFSLIIYEFIPKVVSDFSWGVSPDILIIFSSLLVVILIGLLGIIDDFLGWKKGIRQHQHAILPIFASIPLIVALSNQTTIIIPFIGETYVGLLYPLLFVPLAITGATNAFNMLAGHNGLEAGLGSIIIATLTIFAFLTGETEAALLGVSSVFALLAFLKFNWFPAKIFGGDSLTLTIGAMIGVISLIGGMERLGLFLIALHWVELLFKAKHGFKSECFGIPQKDGTLKPDPRGGSLIHFTLNQKNLSEKNLVILLLFAQGIIALFSFVIFYYGFA